MRELTRAEQEETVRLLRYVIQKITRYADSHSNPATPLHRLHDSKMLYGATEEAREFLKTLDTETGWNKIKRWWAGRRR